MSTVAIIVPNYNYGSYVEDAVESVLAQDLQPDEVLIIDDASTDSSARVLERYRGRVPIVFNETNLGIVENFRKAVSLTSSDYIAFVGADNIAVSTFVRNLKDALDREPGAGIAYFDMEIFGPRAQELAQMVDATTIGDGSHPTFYWAFPDPTPDSLAKLEHDNFINGSAMFRRAAYDAVGGYRRTDGPEDADLFLRMVRADFSAVRVPKALLRYRQHSAGQANTVLLKETAIRRQRADLEAAWAENARLSAWANSLHDALIDAKAWARHLEAQIDELTARIHERR